MPRSAFDSARESSGWDIIFYFFELRELYEVKEVKDKCLAISGRFLCVLANKYK